jgi:hypothetical protein
VQEAWGVTLLCNRSLQPIGGIRLSGFSGLRPTWPNRRPGRSNGCCVVECRTKMEVEAYQMREGLIAFEHNYNLSTVLSLSKIGQETFGS